MRCSERRRAVAVAIGASRGRRCCAWVVRRRRVTLHAPLANNFRIPDKFPVLLRQTFFMRTWITSSIVAFVIKALGCLAIGVVLTGCAHSRNTARQNQGEIIPVLRCRELLIVDEHGKSRAQVALFPASTTKDGHKYPETVLLRLIDENGRPTVKIGASADGSAVSFEGDSERREWSGVQILAQGTNISLKLTGKNGHQKSITPE